MKTRITIALVSLTITCLCYAAHKQWIKNKKPKISLLEAHTRALEALKPKNVDYYCLSAEISVSFSQCDWELHFGATNNPDIWVSVGTDKVRVSEHGFMYW